MKEKKCFGFYFGDLPCGGCTAQKRCKAVLVSDGFDIVAGLVEQLAVELPEDGVYEDTDRMSDLVDQLLNPSRKTTKTSSKEEADLLDLLGS